MKSPYFHGTPLRRADSYVGLQPPGRFTWPISRTAALLSVRAPVSIPVFRPALCRARGSPRLVYGHIRAFVAEPRITATLVSRPMSRVSAHRHFPPPPPAVRPNCVNCSQNYSMRGATSLLGLRLNRLGARQGQALSRPPRDVVNILVGQRSANLMSDLSAAPRM